MSRMGQYRLDLERLPEYEQGWDDMQRGVKTTSAAWSVDQRLAYECGQEDAMTDMMMIGEQE